MNPQAELDGLQQKNIDLSSKNDEYGNLLLEAAEAERKFNIAYAKKIFSLKTEGEPVTTRKAMALGDPEIARLKFDKDVSESLVKACKEHMKALEKSIESYRTRIAWLKAEKLNTS